ncbi:hypothetical protein ACEPAG_5664 [Sanghuangporus baumii]
MGDSLLHTSLCNATNLPVSTMTAPEEIHPEDNKLLVQIATYNTNLQGNAGLPQDLVDWLAPTLKVANFLARGKQAPDIVAVGFQELLPLHLGLSGMSRKVIDSRDALIRSQIEEYAPIRESYMLVAKIVNVGVALLVYVRDEVLGSKVCDVQTQWTGCGPAWMGNKGAVGVRFRVRGDRDEDVGETFTFVNAHLTAHSGNLEQRILDYKQIVGTLLFPPLSASSKTRTTIYDTSHLFFLGDLNFRLTFSSSPSITPPENGDASQPAQEMKAQLIEWLKDDFEREKLKEYDELFVERRNGRVFVGLHEGDFWQFKCTYKYKLKEVDRYNEKRSPAWTDRVMFASYFDSPDSPEKSSIEPILYTSIPSYTTSDHKPVVALLLVPTHLFSSTTPPSPSTSTSTSTSTSIPRKEEGIPTITLPSTYTPTPDKHWILKRYVGRALDRIVGVLWTLLWLVGLGNAAFGLVNFVFGLVAWKWMGRGGSGNAVGEAVTSAGAGEV